MQASSATYNRKDCFNIFVAYFSTILKGEKFYPALTIFKCLNTILYIIIQYFQEHNNVFSSLSSYLSFSPESREWWIIQLTIAGDHVAGGNPSRKTCIGTVVDRPLCYPNIKNFNKLAWCNAFAPRKIGSNFPASPPTRSHAGARRAGTGGAGPLTTGGSYQVMFCEM